MALFPGFSFFLVLHDSASLLVTNLINSNAGIVQDNKHQLCMDKDWIPICANSALNMQSMSLLGTIDYFISSAWIYDCCAQQQLLSPVRYLYHCNVTFPGQRIVIMKASVNDCDVQKFVSKIAAHALIIKRQRALVAEFKEETKRITEELTIQRQQPRQAQQAQHEQQIDAIMDVAEEKHEQEQADEEHEAMLDDSNALIAENKESREEKHKREQREKEDQYDWLVMHYLPTIHNLNEEEQKILKCKYVKSTANDTKNKGWFDLLRKLLGDEHFSIIQQTNWNRVQFLDRLNEKKQYGLAFVFEHRSTWFERLKLVQFSYHASSDSELRNSIDWKNEEEEEKGIDAFTLLKLYSSSSTRKIMHQTQHKAPNFAEHNKVSSNRTKFKWTSQLFEEIKSEFVQQQEQQQQMA